MRLLSPYVSFQLSGLFGGRRRLDFGSRHTSFAFLTTGIIGMTSTFSSDGMKIFLVRGYYPGHCGIAGSGRQIE